MIKVELVSNRLSTKEILDIVDEFSVNRLTYVEEEEYLTGQNTKILTTGTNVTDKKKVDSSIPDWKIPVSYGRKIVKTVTGYMYLPGLINYDIPDDKSDEIIRDIFKENEEPVLNQSLGTYQGTNGKTYELHYLTEEGELKYNFAMLKAYQGFAIYDFSIIPKMVAFIRVYKKWDTEIYVVYYSDTVIQYERFKDDNGKTQLAKTDEYVNVFKEVPVVQIDNNANKVSDISVVKALIDAYDNILSGGMNEFSRFAFAYLKLVGMSIDKKSASDIKRNQIFEGLENKDAVSFLTKDIPTDFLEKTADRIKHEIHRQAFIPDIDELKFGGQTSGVAIERFIYLMEYIAADKEAQFRLGIKKRLRLIQKIEPSIKIDDIEIIFNRNKPASDLTNAQIYAMLDGRGISRESLMLKYTWIENPEEELEKYEEEQSKRKVASFEDDLEDNTDQDDSNEDDIEDEA